MKSVEPHHHDHKGGWTLQMHQYTDQCLMKQVKWSWKMPVPDQITDPEKYSVLPETTFPACLWTMRHVKICLRRYSEEMQVINILLLLHGNLAIVQNMNRTCFHIPSVLFILKSSTFSQHWEVTHMSNANRVTGSCLISSFSLIWVKSPQSGFLRWIQFIELVS